jgi:hypothetical protein
MFVFYHCLGRSSADVLNHLLPLSWAFHLTILFSQAMTNFISIHSFTLAYCGSVSLHGNSNQSLCYPAYSQSLRLVYQPWWESLSNAAITFTWDMNLVCLSAPQSSALRLRRCITFLVLEESCEIPRKIYMFLEFILWNFESFTWNSQWFSYHDA